MVGWASSEDEAMPLLDLPLEWTFFTMGCHLVAGREPSAGVRLIDPH